jgi:hypothetical protein
VDDGGEYICTASSLAGHVSKGHAVTVRGLYKIPFTITRGEQKKVAPRTIRFISCKLHNLADLKKYT